MRAARQVMSAVAIHTPVALVVGLPSTLERRAVDVAAAAAGATVMDDAALDRFLAR